MEVHSPQTIMVESLDEPVDLHAIFDIHLGERGCAVDRLRGDIADIAAKPRALVVLGGDQASLIAEDDRRWEPHQIAADLKIEDLADWGRVITDRLAEVLSPLRGRIIGILRGNHEETWEKRHHCDIMRPLVEALDTRCLGRDCLLTLSFLDEQGRSSEIKLRACHGAGWAASPGGKMNRVRKYMAQVDADLVLTGHLHDRISAETVRLHQAGSELGQSSQLGVMCGTYLRTYTLGGSGYGERAGYDPVGLGHACIQIIPATKKMAVRWV